ncbi:TIGR00341 family protein [Rhodococcus triatomae]|uniref:TIGR00341 family protein n=1 Tax=Rhodococcus triatomae TaxID=300028 RepID=A0A1G8H1M6_9NOCA|nr:TIGR00341 family protein [Rhodococcus triatomae]QNG20234.1 TIGR00341 family protein [Rhodococcus triatomae]QNG23851.1 TIGR00341 family protein [Rhodococcus triatomae]SDI00537.1 TIGR00341 family protein [Rhodococcus triatomae]
MLKIVPDGQRRTLTQLDERLDLSVGDRDAKRSAFWVMLTLSAVIAVAGVVGDSTATVIGAMIVAPLSTPILGVGLGITTGRGHLIRHSLFYVVAGIVLVVVLGVVFAQLLPNPTNVLSNSQVLGRTSPTLMDLAAALATGLVGAIAIARKDVGDVLPGVAIAISLVPPLAVVGVCLGSGAPSLAAGAFVLFASNVVAMVITATAVFVAAGYAREAGIVAGSRRGRAYAVLAVVLFAVTVPMVVNSLSSVWSRQIATAAEQWLADTPGAEVTDVTWQGGTATVTVLGPATLPPLDGLEESVHALIPWDPDVQVVHTVGTRLVGK